jgi:putative salt-induced outer membrane protein YdiY
MSEAFFVFGNAIYEYDKMATYREQVLLMSCFGTNLIDTKNTSVDVGAGYRYSKRQCFDAFLKKKLIKYLALMIDVKYIYNSVVAIDEVHDEFIV